MKNLISLFVSLCVFSSKAEIGEKSALPYSIEMDSAVNYVASNQVLVEFILNDINGQNLGFNGIQVYFQDNNQTPDLIHTFDSTGLFKKLITPRSKFIQIRDPRIEASYVDTPGIVENIPSGYYGLYTSLIEMKGGHHLKIKFNLEMGYPVISDKPIIYLYPEKETKVDVKLYPKGEIKFSYPVYDNGWSYTVTPDGVLHSENRNYYYLFWEGHHTHKLLSDSDMKKGFVVKGSRTQEFFEDVLPKMGLTPTEYNEFIVYWTPLMQNNKYNFIHFKFTEEYARDIAEIEITPKPDNIFRMFMVYKPLYGKIEVEAQKIKKANREGFTVIEWGGSEFKEAKTAE